MAISGVDTTRLNSPTTSTDRSVGGSFSSSFEVLKPQESTVITPLKDPNKDTSQISDIKKIRDPTFKTISRNNVTEAKKADEPSSWGTRVFVCVTYLGILAGIIGIGGLLPYLKIASHLGISGIPLNISTGLLASGAISTCALGVLKISSLKENKGDFEKKLSKLYHDFQKARSDWFIDYNLNNILGTVAFLCLFFTCSPMLVGCLNYPFSFLLLGSGSYQLLESYKEFLNAKNENNSEKQIRSIVNIFNSALLIFYGAMAITSGLNSHLAILASLLNGGISLAMSGYLFIKLTLPKLRELNKTNDLEQTLTDLIKLTDKEFEDIKNKYDITNYKDYDLKKRNIYKWIDENSENWNLEQKKEWESFKQELQNETTLKDETKIMIYEKILKEETKKATEDKLEKFRALVSLETYKELVEAVKNDFQEVENLEALHKKIKKDLLIKSAAEILRTFAYAGFLFFPLLKLTKQIEIKKYDLLISITNFLTLILSIDPKFRIVPPAKQPSQKPPNKEQINSTNEPVPVPA